MNKPLKLQVNTTGAWRAVLDFDCADWDHVLHAAAELFGWSDAAQTSLRVIIPGDTAPLMTWTKEHGWREWGERP